MTRAVVTAVLSDHPAETEYTMPTEYHLEVWTPDNHGRRSILLSYDRRVVWEIWQHLRFSELTGMLADNRMLVSQPSVPIGVWAVMLRTTRAER